MKGMLIVVMLALAACGSSSTQWDGKSALSICDTAHRDLITLTYVDGHYHIEAASSSTLYSVHC